MKLTSLDFPRALIRLIFITASILSLPVGCLQAAVADRIQQYTSRTWETEEGLPNNAVQAIAQTPDGYLWVGTRAGLVRFDGTHFSAFDGEGGAELKNLVVTALCVDETGILWIGSEGGGVTCYRDGSFSHYGKTNGMAGDNVRAIYQRRDGSIWIGTSTGLSQFKDGKFTNYTRLYFTHQPSLVSSIINSIVEDKEGNLWVATSGGLNRLKGTNIDGTFTSANGLPDNVLHAVFVDHEGRLWIGSNTGLAVYENGTFHTYTTRDGLSDNFIASIYQDSAGHQWVGNDGGLNRLVNGSFISEVNEKEKSYDQVNAIFEDQEGNIWVGSKEGLIQLTPRKFYAVTKKQGLSYDNVMSVSQDRAGSLWIGTWGGGLDQLKDGKITVDGPAQGLSFSMVLSTCEARDGSLWVGAEFKGGLARLKNGKFTYYTEKNGLIGDAIKVIHEDRLGNLWLGTGLGLSCLKDGKFKNYRTNNSSLPGNIIRTICEDHAGQMWFGTDKGLSCWSNGVVTNFTTRQGLSDNIINALYEDREQTLWIGTENGGLNRYRDGVFTAYTTQQGLFSDRILEILEDDNGWLWMSCYKGVFRVRKADLEELDHGRAEIATCVTYGKADGMESARCNGVAQPAGWKEQDGRLCFPTSKGLVVVDPNLKVNARPPLVFLEKIIADKKTIDLQKLSAVPRPISGQKSAALTNDFSVTTVPPGAGELEFQYGALSFTSPEKDRFKYKLEGVDSDWIDAGARRFAHYNNIYPGHYRFRVKAANNDGVWNETGAMIGLVLLPHFWQTAWFFGLIAVASIGLVGGTARYLSGKKLRRKLALLEMQHSLEKERARIARDIHDDLGCRLTHITLLSDEVEQDGGRDLQANTRKISATAREMARSLDEIVWAINPEHDTLEGLVNYLSRAADEFLEDTPVRSQLKVPTMVPVCAIPANIRHNLFLAFKEALNNSVRHSGTVELQIHFLVEPAHFQIIIIDTGAGFDPAAPRAEGNGLKNMRQRLAEIGGQFELSTALGQGTTIKMTIQLLDCSR